MKVRGQVRRWFGGLRGPYRHLAVVAAYLLLTLVMTYPLSFRLGTHLLESTNDFWIYPWNNWWVKTALTQGRSVYYTPYLFYPQGAKLFWHGFSWFNTFVWLPLQTVVGSLVAHNITILLTYVLGGYTAYLLAYEVTGSRLAAFVAGLVYAFYPHRFSHRGQLKLLSNQWNPLFAVYLVRLTRRGQLRDGLGAGVALALSGLCGWHQMALAGTWGAMWLAYNLLAERRQWRRSTVLALLLSGLICVILIAPLLVPMLAELARSQGVGLEPSTARVKGLEAREKSTDLLAYVLPTSDHFLLSVDGLGDLYHRYVLFEGPAATIGWVTLLAAGWGMLKRRREALPWLLSALVFAVLALGSVLYVNGRAWPGIPLPYSLLKPSIFGQFIRHPNRFNIVLALPISVLVALGWQAVLERWGSRRRWARWATLCLNLLILFEYCVVPVPTVPPPDSAFYQRLREEEGEFAVVDLPMDLSKDKYYLFLQTLHGRPIVGGHVSRVPVGALDFIETVPLLAEAQKRPPERGELRDISRQLRPLAEAGVRYVIIHKDRTTDERGEGWRRWFSFQPVYEDDLMVAYRTEPVYGRDFDFVGPVGDGIGVVTATLSPQEVIAGGMVRLEVVWGTTREPQEDWVGKLRFLSENGEVVDVAEFEPFEGWPTSEWGSGEVVRSVLVTRTGPFMSGGRYQVAVGLAGGQIVVGEMEVDGIDRSLQASEMERVSAFFGEEAILLLGYDLERSQDELAVTLHWRALSQMEKSYKFFVHLYDAGSGELVAQTDVVPRGWTYPTTQWQAGEVVSDEVHLPLSEVPSGVYRFAVGIYDPQTGERLPISDGERLAVSSNALILQELTLP
jgi:hypothetical protein